MRFRFALALIILSTQLMSCQGSSTPNEPDGSPPDPGGGTNVPLAPAVTKTVDVDWVDQSAMGGYVDQSFLFQEKIFSVSDGRVWEGSVRDNAWTSTTANGAQLVVLSDGALITDRGYRLDSGSREWIDMGFKGALAYSRNDETLFRHNDGHVFLSADHGRTWSQLPAIGGTITAFDANELMLVAIVRDDFDGERTIWAYDRALNEWSGPLYSGSLYEVVVHPDGPIFVGGDFESYWSQDGQEWAPLLFEGEPFRYFRPAGHDSAGHPLVAVWHEVYRLTHDGNVARLLSHKASGAVHHVFQANMDDYLISGSNGIWFDTLNDSARQVGIRGDYVQKVFHMADGSHFASVNPSAGFGYWAKLDAETDRWQKMALGGSHINDVAQLADGSHLLATVNAYEPGYGDLFRWSAHAETEWLLRATPPLLSIAVTASQNYYVSTGEGSEGSSYEILLSTDSGITWETVHDNGEGPSFLSEHCGEIVAADLSGVSRHDPGANTWRLDEDVGNGLVGLDNRDNTLAVYSRKRLWIKADCDGAWSEVPLPENINEIRDIALDSDNGIWAVSDIGGIYFEPGSEEWRYFDRSLPSGILAHLSVDPAGVVWARAAGQGLYSGSLIH